MLLAAVLIILPSLALSNKAAEYDNAYCHDPAEIKRWQGILENNAGNDNVQALHALWLGLCLKVENRQLTVNRANEIFENARQAVVNSFPRNKKPIL